MQNNPATNPFDRLDAAVGSVQAEVDRVGGHLLPALLSNVTTFNGLFYNNASSAMRGLLDCALHINATVVVLPGDSLAMVGTLNTTLAALLAVYEGAWVGLDCGVVLYW